MSNQPPTSHGFRDIAGTRFYRSRSLWQGQKVKSWSDDDNAHLYPLTNVPIKYELPTPYGFRNIAWARLYRSRSLQQGQG